MKIKLINSEDYCKHISNTQKQNYSTKCLFIIILKFLLNGERLAFINLTNKESIEKHLSFDAVLNLFFFLHQFLYVVQICSEYCLVKAILRFVHKREIIVLDWI